MPFIHLKDGSLLNLNCVGKITRSVSINGHVCLEDFDGNALGYSSQEATEGIEGELVPAAKDTFVTIIFTDIDGEIETERQLVVAWRAEGLVAKPVLCEEQSSTAVTLIELPDGMFCRPGVANYSSIEDAKRHYKELAEGNKDDA